MTTLGPALPSTYTFPPARRLRSSGAVPPIVFPEPPTWIRLAVEVVAAVPAEFAPMKLPAIVLALPVREIEARPDTPVITSPRAVEPLLLLLKLMPALSPGPFTSTSSSASSPSASARVLALEQGAGLLKQGVCV